jgi:peptide-methionine (S)-S-oxide reductase
MNALSKAWFYRNSRYADFCRVDTNEHGRARRRCLGSGARESDLRRRMQPAFDHIPGVVSTTVGYTGGDKQHPTYEEVSDGGTGHAESIEITFDPKKVTYQQLLSVFWHNVDPTSKDREFCDVGHQYRTAIFFHGAEQEHEAKASEKEIEETKPFKDAIVTEIVPASTFWPAEDYHQDYYLKNPVHYKFYRYNCGRDQRLRELWGVASGGH